MGNKIASGFHGCVDFELVWSREKMEELIRFYDIHDKELAPDMHMDSERSLLVSSLFYMKEGKGAEFTPEDSAICFDFAQHFVYKVTVGGTATRAAIAIGKIGYECALQLVCFNSLIRERLPASVHYLSSVGENNKTIYPHVILSYPAGEHIHANDVDFVTPRENRLMYSRDIDSMNMVISQAFAPMIQEAEVMLVSCFSEVLDKQILTQRMASTRALLETLPKNAYVVFEDGCYVKKDFRYYVHEQLGEYLNAVSMNEDEMQEYLGTPVDVMDPGEVLTAVQTIHQRLKVPTLIVHSAAWAIAFGANAHGMEHVLKGGICLSSARFQYGDDFGRAEYEKTGLLADKKEGILFAQKIEALAGDPLCCVPTKDLSFVKAPVIVGLGDFFAGGLLPELTAEKRTQSYH